jgi:hypothetical protein
MNSITKPFNSQLGVLLLSIVLALLIVAVFWPSTADAQCSMCRAVAGSNLESGDGVRASGINKAILYLMATPYVLAMIVVYAMFGKKIRVWVKTKVASIS